MEKHDEKRHKMNDMPTRLYAATRTIQQEGVASDAQGYHKNRYVSLDHLLSRINRALHAQGLVLITLQKQQGFTLVFYDEDGDTLSFEGLDSVPPLSSKTPQDEMYAHGKRSTYGVRYALSRFFGIPVDVDTDGLLEAPMPAPVSQRKRLYKKVEKMLMHETGMDAAGVKTLVGLAMDEHEMTPPQSEDEIGDFVSRVMQVHLEEEA